MQRVSIILLTSFCLIILIICKKLKLLYYFKCFFFFFFVVFIFISFSVDQNKLVYKITRCGKSYRTIWLFIDLIRLEFYLSIFTPRKWYFIVWCVYCFIERRWSRLIFPSNDWTTNLIRWFCFHHFFYAPLQTNAHKHCQWFLLSRFNTSSFGHCSKCKQLPISNGFR